MNRRPQQLRGGGLAGIVMTLIGALGFASKGVFAKLLYASGWNVDAVLTTRAFVALPIVAAWALWHVPRDRLFHPPLRPLLGAAAAGATCYYIGALLDFRALTMIAASVERVLLFSYPSMVVILHFAFYRERPQARALAALAMTYAGILMVVTGLDMGVLRGNLTGAGLVLATAMTSALYYLASDRWTQSIGSVAFTFYALTAATLCLLVHRFATPGAVVLVWNPHTLWLLAGLVIFATVVPMLAMAEGVRRLGAPRASIVSTIGPPATIVLGAMLLGEQLTTPQWAGVALIVAGIMALEFTRTPGGDAVTKLS